MNNSTKNKTTREIELVDTTAMDEANRRAKAAENKRVDFGNRHNRNKSLITDPYIMNAFESTDEKATKKEGQTTKNAYHN